MRDPGREFWEEVRAQEAEDLAKVEKELIPAFVQMISEKNLLIKVVDEIPSLLSKKLEYEEKGITRTQRFKITIPR